MRKLLDSIVAQTLPPDEIVIVDGGSTDDTVEQIQNYANRLPLRLLIEPGANISRGRNAAIQAAKGDIIAITDAGVRLSPNWLDAITQPLRENGDVMAVSGFFSPDPESPFEVAMGATTLPTLEDIDPGRFLPSSRSFAIRKEAWARVGGYPEWLDYCEDLIFDFELRDAYGPFAWAPEAIAHFRPRSSLSAFFKQYYRYSRGDGKADLWRKRHAIRYGVYLLAAPALLVLGEQITPLFWLLGLAGFGVYCRTPYRRLFRAWRTPLANGRFLTQPEKLYTLLLVPIIRVTGDVAKMLGYPVGVWWRLSRQRGSISEKRSGSAGAMVDDEMRTGSS
ncbi:MAG: glycosyltransferase [Chloroflexi bacterium]|nr:glycosyltransferase [Chloroflexota bacterium]